MKRITKLSLILLPFCLLLVLATSEYLYQDPFYFIKPGIHIENPTVTSDKDRDGINDADDLVAGARMEVKNKTVYRSAYYEGGYPPIHEGVCADVIIRAMLDTGYNLKDSMDRDIIKNLSAYSRTIQKPDPNIDFRRVRNQITYFRNNATNLTKEVIPYDKDNLSQWQPGDIVVLKSPDHVAVISDLRRKDGVPYVIHNSPPRAKENNRLMQWHLQGRIIGHFRIY